MGVTCPRSQARRQRGGGANPDSLTPGAAPSSPRTPSVCGAPPPSDPTHGPHPRAAPLTCRSRSALNPATEPHSLSRDAAPAFSGGEHTRATSVPPRLPSGTPGGSASPSRVRVGTRSRLCETAPAADLSGSPWPSCA